MSPLLINLVMALTLTVTGGSLWAMLTGHPLTAIFILLLGIFLMLIQIFVAIKTRDT